MSIETSQFIGDTVTRPDLIIPLRENDCRIPIPSTHFFIIGTAKCGSTTLAAVLASHPDCCLSAPKETNFFSLNFDRGWDWYRGTFAHYNGQSVLGEASVSYTHTPFRANAAPRVYGFNPSAKLVFIVRHPYERLVSGWKMATTGPGYLGYHEAMKGFEPYVLHMREIHPESGEWRQECFGWSAAIPPSPDQTPIFLDSVRYGCQLANYQKLFPEDQIKIMFLEDWKANPRAEAHSLCEFVGLDPAKLPVFDQRGTNRADQRIQIRPIAKFLGDSSTLAPIRALLPKSIRSPLRRFVMRSRWSVSKKAYPDFNETPRFRKQLMGYLERATADFLRDAGKPQDFWDFEGA